jgi:hypothetical protein
MDETARHLALWMSYEDTVRVADLKTRRSRFDRVGGEVKLSQTQHLGINEFMHPRIEEIADTLPAGLGRWLLATPLGARLRRALHAQGPRGADQLDPRLPAAVRDCRAAAAAAPLIAV